jgi:hypothetical protein
VTLDHPWMLRRYVFAVLPLLIFYSLNFLHLFFENKKKLFYIFSGLLIIGNLTISCMYLTASENSDDLLGQVETMSQNFSGNDLVLIDREAAGSGWSMMSGPMNFLYGKQAVYFFNPLDLDKIDKTLFDHIYLIIPNSSVAFWEKYGIMERLDLTQEYLIDNRLFDDSRIKDSRVLPRLQNKDVLGGIYLLRK